MVTGHIGNRHRDIVSTFRTAQRQWFPVCFVPHKDSVLLSFCLWKLPLAYWFREGLVKSLWKYQRNAIAFGKIMVCVCVSVCLFIWRHVFLSVCISAWKPCTSVFWHTCMCLCVFRRQTFFVSAINSWESHSDTTLMESGDGSLAQVPRARLN